MSFKKAWIYFLVFRVLFFAAAFAGIMFLLPPSERIGLTWGVVFAAVTAAMISTALSVLFLGKLRRRAAEGIAHWRTQSHRSDDQAEDALLEAAATTEAAQNTAPAHAAVPAATAGQVAEAPEAAPEAAAGQPRAE